MQKSDILQVKGSNMSRFLFKGEIGIDLFRGWFENLHASFEFMVDECHLQFRKDGIIISVIDDSHVGMGLTRLSKNDFESYELHEDFKFGINLVDFCKSLKATGSNADKRKQNPTIFLKASEDQLIIKYGLRNKRFPGIVIGDYDEKESKTMKYLEESLEDKFTSEFEIDTKKFVEIVKENEALYDISEFTQHEYSIVIESCENGIKDTVEMDINEFPILDSKFDSDASFTCNLEFLNAYLKKSGVISDSVKVKLGYNIPGLLEINFGTDSYFKYLLAPRVDDNDEEEEDFGEDFGDRFEEEDFEMEESTGTDLPTRDFSAFKLQIHAWLANYHQMCAHEEFIASKTWGPRMDNAITQIDDYSFNMVEDIDDRVVFQVGGGTNPMKIIIDRENHVIEHGGCPDWEHRCIDEGKLCKHLVMLFLKRMLAGKPFENTRKIDEYEFKMPALEYNTLDLSMVEYYPQIEYHQKTRANPLTAVNCYYIPPATTVAHAEPVDNMEAEINRVISEMEKHGELLSTSSRIRQKQIAQIKGQLRKELENGDGVKFAYPGPVNNF